MYRKYLLVLLTVLLVVLTASATQAQGGFRGCGRLFDDVEGQCVFFLPYAGGSYILDYYGDFVEGDSVYVEGPFGYPNYPWSACQPCGMFGVTCIHNESIVAASEAECYSTGCCQDRVGDANGLGGDEPTIGDISVMIDALFITGRCAGIIDCLAEADVNQSGGCDPTCADITIGDISDVIFCTFLWEGDCHLYVDCLSCPRKF